MFYSANAETTRVQKKCHLKKLKKFLFYEVSFLILSPKLPGTLE